MLFLFFGVVGWCWCDGGWGGWWWGWGLVAVAVVVVVPTSYEITTTVPDLLDTSQDRFSPYHRPWRARVT